MSGPGTSGSGQERGAERTRRLRAERARMLAARGALRAERAGEAHLVCRCGAERFGLPLEAAAQILPLRPCTPVPGAVPALLGLAAVSGRIVSVLGLARALGKGGDPEADGHLVLLRSGPVALAVDRVLGIAHLGAADGAVRNLGGMGGEAVSGYAPARADTSDPGDFVVLDLPRLLRRALP